jgi:hypothetical protein
MGCEVPVIKEVEAVDLRALRERGQLLRGEFLDAFAKLEAAVMDYIVRLELKAAPGTPLTQKLTRLSGAKDHFVHPKKLEERIKAITLLNDKRTDLVHAVLTVIVRYDGSKAIENWFGFQNACHTDKKLRILTVEEMKDMVREAKQLSSQFSHQQLKEAAPAAPAAASG